MWEPVSFQSRQTLFGILHSPKIEHGNSGTGVIFLHGWSGYRTGPNDIFVETARILEKEGIHSLRFDLSGRGDSLGVPAATTLDIMIEDTLSAISFMRDKSITDIYLLGICSGGNAALGTASLCSDVRLILWSTPLFSPYKKGSHISKSQKKVMFEYMKKAVKRESWIKLLKGGIDFKAIKKTIFKEKAVIEDKKKDSARDIMQELKGFKNDILFIYGTNDEDSIGAPEFYLKYCTENRIPSEFHTIQGANHSFYSHEWKTDVIEKTVDWIKTHKSS